MNPELEDLKARLASLAPEERAELAQFLLDSLGPGEEDVEAAWVDVASRRVQEIRDGAARGRDAGEFLAELNERYP